MRHWIHLRIVQRCLSLSCWWIAFAFIFSSLQPSEILHCRFISVLWSQSVHLINSRRDVCVCVCVWGTVQTRSECVCVVVVAGFLWKGFSLFLSQSENVTEQWGWCLSCFFYLFLKVHKLFFFFLRLESRTKLCSYNLTSVPFSFLLSFLLMSAW